MLGEVDVLIEEATGALISSVVEELEIDGLTEVRPSCHLGELALQAQH
jgi:hypothetical protein